MLSNINLNLLRVFEAVCRLGSMTKAAEEVHLTQSGVSQNMKLLEDLLGIPLFDRVKGRPIPTPKGRKLFDVVKKQLHELEGTFADILDEELSLAGEVHIGIPIEYGNAFILPLAARFGEIHNKVSFRFFYGHASQVNHMLLRGELDFAIVDNFNLDKQIESFELTYEIHRLCGQKSYLEKFGGPSIKKEYLKRLNYIAYLENAPVLRSWFDHHVGKAYFEERIKATLMDVQGVAQLVLNGLGVGILPEHVLQKLQDAGNDIVSFPETKEPLYNYLSFASLKSKTMSLQAKGLSDFLEENLRRPPVINS